MATKVKKGYKHRGFKLGQKVIHKTYGEVKIIGFDENIDASDLFLFIRICGRYMMIPSEWEYTTVYYKDKPGLWCAIADLE